MADITAIPGIADLRRHTRGGDPGVCVAVLDGPVDLDHPYFAGADLTPLATLASGRATGGGMSRHGTHVASVIFGRHDGPVPGCAGVSRADCPDLRRWRGTSATGSRRTSTRR